MIARFNALTVIGLAVIVGAVVLWELTFSVDPRIRPHPWLLRRFEPPWEDWDALTWDEKMRMFRRRKAVQWGFVVVVGAAIVGLFVIVALAPPLHPDLGAASIGTIPDPFAAAVTPDGRWLLVSEPGHGAVAALQRQPDGGFRLVRTVHLGGQPEGVALTPDGRTALVADFSQDTLVALAVAGLERGAADPVLARVPVGAGASEVALAPDGRTAFVSDERGASVDEVRLPAPGAPGGRWPTAAAASVKVDRGPAGLAMSSDGRRLFVACEAGTLLVIDTATDTVERRVAVGRQPVRVALHDGVAWVTVRGQNRLEAFAASDLGRLATVRVGPAPVGVALVDGGALAVVADSDRFARHKHGSYLSLVSTAAALAGRPAVLAQPAAGWFPRQFAVTPGGKELILTNYWSDQVLVYDVSRLAAYLR